MGRRSKRFKVHGPPRHPPPDPPNQVRPPDLLPPELDRRYWYISYKRGKISVHMISLLLVVLGIIVMVSGEINWHYCLPVVVVVAIIGVISVVITKKR